MAEDLAHGGYWWLAYSFTNYVLSCSVCNRSLKRDHFPLIRSGSRHYGFAQRARLAREARILLDPFIDPLESWVRPNWQDDLCLVEPRSNISPVARKRVERAVKFFRLNIDPDLVRARLKVIDAVQEALDQGDAAEAGLFAVRYRPHSFVASEFLRDVAPQHLPTPQVELEWLLRALLDELDLELRLNELNPDKFLNGRINELLWSLGVLWLDPPAGTPANLDVFFAKEEVDGLIRPLRDKLAAHDGA
ncbi:hypothetical protein [Fimbriiglobus ruber]|uniref:hypothetical protein n=1 Tax=Fimbriiglobus ruber TaxID=1908690 RepID=UPI000B4BAB97|nr:hypothetical protein [Fimbriiglobus ruber]